MNDEQRIERRRVVAWAIRMTVNTALAPNWYERKLLAQFIQGALTIDQVAAFLEDMQQTQVC